jgi:methylase of polypeptide chain release factors-like protein
MLFLKHAGLTVSSIYNHERMSVTLGERMFRILQIEGYVTLLSSFDPRKYPHVYVKSILAELTDPLRANCELLCLGNEVELVRFTEEMRSLLYELCNTGIARRVNQRISIAPLSLYIVQGMLYFSEIPNSRISIYFGEDSVALASRLNLSQQQRPSHGKFLDLCSGPGIQGLLAASYGYEVTAVEINPLAAEMSRCNARFNGIPSRRYTVHESSLVEYLSRPNCQKYYKIVANPPLVPVPSDEQYQFVGHGGVAGLEITTIIVEKASQLLQDGGELTTLGFSGGNKLGPYVLDVVSSVTSSGHYIGNLSILGCESVSKTSRFVKSVAKTINGFKDDTSTSPGMLASKYFKSDISVIYSYFLSLMRIDVKTVVNDGLKVYDFAGSTRYLTWWI